MTEKVRMTRDIHNFVRGKLNFGESLQLLNEILDSEELLQHLEIDMLINEMAREEQVHDASPLHSSIKSKDNNS